MGCRVKGGTKGGPGHRIFSYMLGFSSMVLIVAATRMWVLVMLSIKKKKS